jgi:hypothetical protein
VTAVMCVAGDAKRVANVLLRDMLELGLGKSASPSDTSQGFFLCALLVGRSTTVLDIVCTQSKPLLHTGLWAASCRSVFLFDAHPDPDRHKNGADLECTM